MSLHRAQLTEDFNDSYPPNWGHRLPPLVDLDGRPLKKRPRRRVGRSTPDEGRHHRWGREAGLVEAIAVVEGYAHAHDIDEAAAGHLRGVMAALRRELGFAALGEESPCSE